MIESFLSLLFLKREKSSRMNLNSALFFSNEDEDDGFLISDTGIGMRMKAMEYWKCSETGLTSGNSQESIRFVLVESLKGQGNVMHALKPIIY